MILVGREKRRHPAQGEFGATAETQNVRVLEFIQAMGLNPGCTLVILGLKKTTLPKPQKFWFKWLGVRPRPSFFNGLHIISVCSHSGEPD